MPETCQTNRARNAVFVAIAILCLSGCAQSLGPATPNTATIGTPAKSPDGKNRPARIALLLPFGGMGEPAKIARGMKQAAEMALFEANDPTIQLIAKDDGGTPQGALAATDAAISEGAEIILGPLFGTSAAAAAPIAAKAGVPIVSFSNDASVAGRGVYLMSFLAAEEVDRVVSYAASHGKRRFAALIAADSYGQIVGPAFRAAVAKSGGEIALLETYAPDAASMLASAKRVFQSIADAEKAGSPIDALFVPAGHAQLAQLGPLLAYSGFDSKKVKLLGTSAWDVPVITRDDQLVGGWYAASDPQAWAAFAGKFRKNFGNEPPRLASLAYDATAMALALAKNPAPDRFATAYLTRETGFSGVDGPVRLLPNGLSARGLAVLEIEKYRSVVIDAAPIAPATSRVSSASPDQLSY